MYKSEIWEVQKRTKENSDRIADWVALRRKTAAIEEDLSGQSGVRNANQS